MLPLQLSELYTHSTAVLKPAPPNQDQLSQFRIRKAIRADLYPSLIEQLVSTGMVHLMDKPPLCVNGFFAVPKDGIKQRLIIDCRRANLFFAPPPKVDLVTPSQLADLILGPDERLWVGKTDIKNMYHSFAMPEWMTR